MSTKTCLSITLMLVLAAALTAIPAVAGEYHTGANLICADCHTMHASMQHGFNGGSVSTTPVSGGNWLSTAGPQPYLLKDTANQLCLDCHDGQTFAPDVFAANTNAGSQPNGREAGALNDAAVGAPYDTWTGHTLGATTSPPGFDPTVVGLAANWYDPTGGLECISCHAQHGPAGAYRNLGPYAMGASAANFRPSYVISNTDDTTKDVWINLASYTAGTGLPATFAPYYDMGNINFNRNDATVGTTKTSNKMDTFCAACHGVFHGGPGDTDIGATTAALDGFIRHPTSQVIIGAAGTQGYGGHSSLSRFVTGSTTAPTWTHVNKVHVYASDQTAYTDASPGCITCHKAHGNQNPFGLIFMESSTGTVSEEGTTGVPDPMTGQRYLCGQCHGQGAY